MLEAYIFAGIMFLAAAGLSTFVLTRKKTIAVFEWSMIATIFVIASIFFTYVGVSGSF